MAHFKRKKCNRKGARRFAYRGNRGRWYRWKTRYVNGEIKILEE